MVAAPRAQINALPASTCGAKSWFSRYPVFTPIEATTSWSYIGAGLRLSAELLGPEYSMKWNSLDSGLNLFFSREVTGRAGEYAAEWTVGALPVVKRRLIQAAPPALRMVLVGWVARDLVRNTCRASRMDLRWRAGRGEAVINGSIFCEVRDPVELPLCEYYASAIRRLMQLFGLRAEVVIEHCRGVEAGSCRMGVLVQPAGAEG